MNVRVKYANILDEKIPIKLNSFSMVPLYSEIYHNQLIETVIIKISMTKQQQPFPFTLANAVENLGHSSQSVYGVQIMTSMQLFVHSFNTSVITPNPNQKLYSRSSCVEATISRNTTTTTTTTTTNFAVQSTKYNHCSMSTIDTLWTCLIRM